MSKEMGEQINKIKNFGEFLNENDNLINELYDLVSQFKGDHHGSPMSKNKFLNSLGLKLDGIENLQIWINLMVDNKNWLNKNYPNGTNDTQIINDIINKVGNLSSFIENNKSVNPIKISNYLMDTSD